MIMGACACNGVLAQRRLPIDVAQENVALQNRK